MLSTACSELVPLTFPETPKAGSSASSGGGKDPWGDQWKEQDFSCPSSHIPSSALAPSFTSLFVHSNSAQLCPGYQGFKIKIPALPSEFCRAVLGSWLLQAPGGELGLLLSFADLSAADPLLLQCPAQAPPFPVLGHLH